MTRKLFFLMVIVLFVFLGGNFFANPPPPATTTKNVNQAPMPSIGTVTDIKGDVTIDNGKKLQQGSTISMGVTITTGIESKVIFTMIDQAIIALDENSVLTINEYRYAAEATDNSIIMKIMDGIFRTISGKVGKKKTDQYQVTTPCLLNIGIQGTDYQVNFSDNKESISAHQGVIAVEKANLFGPPKKALLGDQQKERYITIKKPSSKTRATGTKWKKFSNATKPADFPPPLAL